MKTRPVQQLNADLNNESINQLRALIKHGWMQFLSVLFMFTFLSLCFLTQVQSQQTQSKAEAEKKLRETQKALEKAQKKQKGIQTSIGSIEKERARLNKLLIQTARSVQESEAALTKIENRLGELREQKNIIQGSIAQRNETISGLLAAMQRMGRQPPPVMTTHHDDALKMVRSAMLLATVFPQINSQVQRLSGELTDLVRILTDINSQVVTRRKKVALLAKEKTRINELIETKKATILSKQTELADIRKDAQTYAQEVTTLNELIAKLDERVSQSESAGLKRYETELARETENRDTGLQPKVEAESNTRTAAIVRPGRIKPALPFDKAKGLLPVPVIGKRLKSYGSSTEYGSQSEGISVQTRANAQVTSPSDGWVVYAGPFRSYGQLLIMNAGGGYHILLAGMNNIYVKVGQFVLAGEPVATMGGLQANYDNTDLNNNEAENRPVLYIEFRKNGSPVDPDPWWAKGSEKAQG